jgi:pyridoxamine 5'-phosphate oxidase-like protein
MAIATRPEKQAAPTTIKSHATTEQVWREIEKASFAVVAYVTPSGEARSSGVVYKTVGRHLYFAVAPESWKARHIAVSKHVSVTIPVHRGGILALVAPIPPATISFHAAGIVHAAGSVRVVSMLKELESLLPAERRDSAVLIELIPEGRFLTYGVGISLTDMQKPELAEAVVPVSN